MAPLDTSNVINAEKVTVQTLRDMVNDPRLDSFLDAEVVPVIYPVPGNREVSIDGQVQAVAVTRDKEGVEQFVMVTTLPTAEFSMGGLL